MTQEDKELLIKDLCGRLPYGVKICYIYNGEECVSTIEKIDAFSYIWDNYNGCYHVREIKPYLFPLSSMTEEQREELYKMGWYLDEDKIYTCFRNYDDANYKTHTDCLELINWCYENHLDINGLIPKDLAIDATDKNIY